MMRPYEPREDRMGWFFLKGLGLRQTYTKQLRDTVGTPLGDSELIPGKGIGNIEEN